ncbi:MarR family winged helix-turn-helix transcriptional regulator [Blastococcus sp. VKM Ac-2987]|uniref:MarR family winged helix-turn-helix transcriptional regulator n=1 Tax=Blastococcus sp. VKM Ac-2987 TaxID=3004141 RepID=UPI0022AB81AA|nr:MarR family transcriptional regulator [Blastococcus sp. VKM Ac-2987]MCZ2859227.1 MarR family transcriptional regulator [Blastococcus sp. VKM Ac-2987]
MTSSPTTGVPRDAGVGVLGEQLPRFMRLMHGLKNQHAAEGGRDRAAHVLLFPLCRLGPLRQGALADLVHADPSTVSRHVTLLVEQGLVRRAADESDGRASNLVVTDAGRAQLDKLRVEREAYLRQVTADWTEEELQTFTALFERLLDGVAATLPSDLMSTTTDRTVTA